MTIDNDLQRAPLGETVPRSVVRGFSGARLRQRRTERGFTTDDLADLAGVSPPVVSGWETGRYLPTPHLLGRAAAALDITIQDLVVLPPDKALLSDLRAQAGLTQADVAQSLETSPSSLGRIEKGRKPVDRETAGALAGLYGVTEDRVVRAWELTVATRAARLRSL